MIGLPEFEREYTGFADLDEVQERISEAFFPLTSNPLAAEGNTEQVTLGTTETVFAHKLGRQPQGWIVIDKDADARVWRSSESTVNNIYLTATATVTVSVRIF